VDGLVSGTRRPTDMKFPLVVGVDYTVARTSRFFFVRRDISGCGCWPLRISWLREMRWQTRLIVLAPEEEAGGRGKEGRESVR
jgi:hypothetical protein